MVFKYSCNITNEENNNKSKDFSRKRPMKEAMRTDASKYDV